MLTQNATWCQNRGCICISSVRRTYGRIHIPASTIILWTELFPKKRREKIQGEILQSSSNTVVFPQIIHSLQELQDFFEYNVFYSVSTHNPATPRYSTYRINSSTRILQEILQQQGSHVQAPSSNCSPCLQAFYMAEPSSKHPRIDQVEEEF